MNKFVLLAAMSAFLLPIGGVVALQMSGGDLNTLVSHSAANESEIPTGKLLYFYAPS